MSSGVKIAYISGVEASDGAESTEWNFNEADVNSVTTSCLSSNNSAGDYRGVDILMTSQWSAGVRENEPNTSKLLSWLSSEIKPRYHFCGLNDSYFEPPPYRNVARVNSQLELATRFIAMASVGNAAKNKWIYALNLTPVDKMRLSDLIQKTTNEVPCPYDLMGFSRGNRQQADGKGGGQYFYDMNAFPGEDRRRHKRDGFGRDDGRQKRPRVQVFDQGDTLDDTLIWSLHFYIDFFLFNFPEKCWFCLSSPSVEKHLVISIGDKFYLALAKGPINEYHILILSVTHIQSTSLLTEDDWNELSKFKTALIEFFATKDQVVVFFERNYKSGHLQINVIPVDKALAWKIKHAFEDKAEEYNLPLETLSKLQVEHLPERGPYFVAELPDDVTLLCKQMKLFPLHFGREVFCSPELFDCEGKSDWHECSLTKETEVDYVKKFRTEFQPFDFTM